MSALHSRGPMYLVCMYVVAAKVVTAVPGICDMELMEVYCARFNSSVCRGNIPVL